MLPDMWFHIYYLLITTMQIPELKTIVINYLVYIQ